MGAGVDLITACDIRYCSAGARFCVKEVDIAIVADMGTLQRLPGIVGQGPSTVHIERLSSSDVSHQLWLVLFTMQFYTLSHSSRVVYSHLCGSCSSGPQKRQLIAWVMAVPPLWRA